MTFGRLGRALTTAAVASWTTTAVAADAPAICANAAFTTADIDKDVLAEEALIQAGVSAVVRVRLDAWRKTDPSAAEFAGLTSREALALHGAKVCDRMGCTKDEAQKVTKAAFIMLALLKDTEHFAFSGDRSDPVAFIRSPSTSIRCSPAATQSLAIVAPLPAGSDKVPQSAWGLNERVSDAPPKGSIRIRGKAEDLIYAQYDASFTDASKANIGFEWDELKSKGKTSVVAAVGYSILSPSSFNAARTRRVSWGLIPYVAVNLETSKAKGEAREFDSNAFDFGATFQLVTDTYSARFRRAASQYIAITPHFAINRADDSRLLALNALYRPTISISPSLAINGFSDFELGEIPLKWEPILDARFAYGHFTSVGTRTGDAANDFTRVGFRYGLALSSKIDSFPLDLVVTHNPMFAVSGATGDISLFESTLSLYFDADKHFGTDLKYSRGRATDLDERVAKWSVAFAIRY